MPLYSPTNLSITGNTGGAPLLVGDVIYLSGGANVTLNQTSQTIEIVGGAGGGGAADGFNRISAGTQLAGTLATVVFSNSNGLSFGMSNSSIITASFAAIKTISAGTASLTNGQLSFADSNGLAFGINAGTITGSYTVPTQTVESQSLGMSNLGNTSGTTGVASGGQVRFLFAGGNNITLSQSLNGASGTITISAFNSIAPTGISSIVGSDATYTSGSVQFSGSNIVTVRSSANQRIIIDASQSIQTQNRFNLTLDGNTAGVLAQVSSGTLTLAGGNNIVLSQNGNAITISGSNFNQTNQTVGLYAVGNTTGESSSSTFDARTLSFRGAGIASVGYSTGVVLISVPSGGGAGDGVNILAAGTQTANTTGTVLFNDGNGISFGMNNSSVITASYTVPVVSNGILDVGTATASGTATSRFAAHDHVHRGVIGVDVNGIASTFYGTVQLSAGNLISVATGGNSTRGSMQIINLLSSSAIANPVSSASNAGTLSSRFALADHAHAGLNSISVVGNTAGTTTAGAGSIVLAGGPNITLSGSTAGGGMTLSISGGAGGGGATFSGGISNLGNTYGTSGTVSGQLVHYATNPFGYSQSVDGASASLSLVYGTKPPYFEIIQSGPNLTQAVTLQTFSGRPIFQPFVYNASTLNLNTIRLYMSRISGTSMQATMGFGLYTLNGVSLSLLASSTQSYSLTASSQFNALRAYEFSGFSSNNLTPGFYVAAFYITGPSTASINLGLWGGKVNSWLGTVHTGADNTSNTNATNKLVPWHGFYSTTTGAFPSNVQASEMQAANSNANLSPWYTAFIE